MFYREQVEVPKLAFAVHAGSTLYLLAVLYGMQQLISTVSMLCLYSYYTGIEAYSSDA